jgi:hypothetical protein
MNASSSARTGIASLGYGSWSTPRRLQPIRPAERTKPRPGRAGFAVGLTALIVVCGVLFVSLSPKQGARPASVVASIQTAKISGHFRDADVKTIFGAIAAQVRAQLVVDPDLSRKIDTFDVEGERLQDVMNDLCTISACEWSLEAGSPPTLTVRQRAKSNQ